MLESLCDIFVLNGSERRFNIKSKDKLVMLGPPSSNTFYLKVIWWTECERSQRKVSETGQKNVASAFLHIYIRHYVCPKFIYEPYKLKS